VGATAAASYGVFAAAAVVAGLAAVALARLLGIGGTTVFMDGWVTPPLPHASVFGWVLGGLIVAVPLAATAGRAARRLARAVAAGERGGQP
jgi:hypothetical protein